MEKIFTIGVREKEAEGRVQAERNQQSKLDHREREDPVIKRGF